MNIAIKSLNIENFKGIKNLTVDFGKHTKISGENASGKTTIFDAVTWLLFNKNSLGVEKFDIRPLDEYGKTVDYVEILVQAEFEKDDDVFILEKKQKQKWTKHTGDETETFTGNANEYAVNGFPKSEKEYKAFIAEIIDEEHFKLLSSPTYFVNLPWKKQREFLMSLVSEETDLDFAKRVGVFDELIPELELAPKTADIVEKWKRTKKDLDTKAKELPVRIDEMFKATVDLDVEKLKADKANFENKVAIAKGHNDESKLNELKAELSELKLAKSTMESKAHEEYLNAKSHYQMELNAHCTQKDGVRMDIRKAELNIANLDAQIERYNSELSELGAKYMEVHKSTFDASPYDWDESSEICPTCNRKLPDEEIATAKARMADNRDKALKAFIDKKSSEENILINKGNEVKEKGEKASEERKGYEDTLRTLKQKLESLVAKDAEIEALNVAEPNLTGQKDYDYLVAQIEEKQKAIDSVNSTPVADISALENELNVVNGLIAKATANESIKERIEALKAEQRDVAQKIATAEKMLFLLDKFTKAKLESISNVINGKFRMMNFKLFNQLLNGGIEECCEATYNGVPYSSLNNGMRICGGLDIINTISREFGKTVFVFVDNAESVNEYKMPEVSGQLIALTVTADKELKVES